MCLAIFINKKNVMSRKILLLILILITFFSCKDKTKQNDKYVFDYEVYKTQEIILAEEDRDKEIELYKQLADIDSKNVLIMNIDCKYLSFYDLKSGKKIHDILVDSLGEMRSFYYIGKDSIFISCSNFHGKKELEAPQALRLIDWDGNVKKIYGYDIDQEELNNYNYDINKILPPRKDFIFSHGSIIFNSTYYDSYGSIGTKEFVKNPLPLGVRIDTKENIYHVSKQRKFANIEEGMYYPNDQSIRITKSANGLPLFRYPYSSSIFEWDFDNDIVIEHLFKSALADSIMPSPYPNDYGHDIPYCYDLLENKYDECNQVYVSTILFNEKVYGKIKWGLIFADKNFQYIGEMFEPKYWPDVSNNDILLDIQTNNDSIVTINYLKLVKSNRDYNKYIDSCRNVLQTMKQSIDAQKNALLDGYPPINFVKKQMNIKESSYKILTIYCNEGCTGCEGATVYTLIENKGVLNKIPLYIILSAYNPTHLASYLEQTGLSYFNKIVSDSTGLMKSVAKSSTLLNPRLTIVENGTVTLDTIYQAMDIEDKLLPQIIGPDEHSRYVLDKNGEVIVTTKQ